MFVREYIIYDVFASCLSLAESYTIDKSLLIETFDWPKSAGDAVAIAQAGLGHAVVLCLQSLTTRLVDGCRKMTYPAIFLGQCLRTWSSVHLMLVNNGSQEEKNYD